MIVHQTRLHLKINVHLPGHNHLKSLNDITVVNLYLKLFYATSKFYEPGAMVEI